MFSFSPPSTSLREMNAMLARMRGMNDSGSNASSMGKRGEGEMSPRPLLSVSPTWSLVWMVALFGVALVALGIPPFLLWSVGRDMVSTWPRGLAILLCLGMEIFLVAWIIARIPLSYTVYPNEIVVDTLGSKTWFSAGYRIPLDSIQSIRVCLDSQNRSPRSLPDQSEYRVMNHEGHELQSLHSFSAANSNMLLDRVKLSWLDRFWIYAFSTLPNTFTSFSSEKCVLIESSSMCCGFSSRLLTPSIPSRFLHGLAAALSWQYLSTSIDDFDSNNHDSRSSPSLVSLRGHLASLIDQVRLVADLVSIPSDSEILSVLETEVNRLLNIKLLHRPVPRLSESCPPSYDQLFVSPSASVVNRADTEQHGNESPHEGEFANPGFRFEDWITIEHPVSEFDTLTGLALRYNIQEKDILLANELMSASQIRALKMVKIPFQPSDGQVKDNPRQLTQDERNERDILLFSQQLKCAIPEAKYYLECRNYDFKEAVRDHLRDKMWESHQYDILSRA